MRFHVGILFWTAAVALTAISALELVPQARQPPPAVVRGSIGPTGLLMQAEEGWGPVARQLNSRGIHGVVGYWGPVPPSDLHGEGPLVERFYQAQFTLAPVVLEADGLEEWMVTDLRAEENRPMPPGYVLVRDFGGGRQLLRRVINP